MTTLAIDTSSKACSIAVTRDGLLLCEGYLNVGLTHSATLTALLSQTLAAARLDFEQIDRLAVSAGPGSYTGLRIGMAAVKGLAMPAGLPCAGVSTLLGLAYNLQCFAGEVCAVLDARVGQVFAARFLLRDGVVTRLTPDDAITLEALAAQLPDGAMLCGDGADMVCEKLAEKRLQKAPAALRYQRASGIAAAVEAGDPQVLFGAAAALTPAYHRLSQAERERAARLAQQPEQSATTPLAGASDKG